MAVLNAPPLSSKRRKQVRRRRLLYVGLTGLLVAWMALHYAVVCLHLLPRNAITILHPDFIEHYVQPFFSQDWHLFAPKPPTTNDRFLIQLQVQPLAAGAGGEPRLTRWFDVTSPLERRIWANPLAPEVTRLRTIDGISGQYRNFLARRAAYPPYEFTTAGAFEAQSYQQLLLVLAREVHDPARFRLLAMRGRTVIEEVAPFSEFQNPKYRPKKPKAVTTDWFLPPGVEPGI